MSHPSSQSGDTQPISQSVYDSILKKSDTTGADAGANVRDTARSFGFEYSEAGATQKTLNEGDTGHIDLLAGFGDTENIQENNSDEDKDNEDHGPGEIGDSPPTRYEPFPESQRFLNHTPAPLRGRATEWDHNATPSISGNPFNEEHEASSTIMGLSQLFKATQAPSSPGARPPRPDLSSDMPSPNLPIQRQGATAPMTSPLQMTSSVKRPRPAEPQTSYVSLKESQTAREKLLRSASNDGPGNVASDDGFDEDSMLQRRVRRRLDEEKVGMQFAIVTAQARPDTDGRTRKAASLSPSIGRQRPNLEETVLPKSFQVVPTSGDAPIANGNEGESEVETEQEDEGLVQPNQSSQRHQDSGEEDKENFESGPVQVSGIAAWTHDALSQALDMEGSPSARKGSFAGIPASTGSRHLPENVPEADAGGTEHDVRIINSQLDPTDISGQVNEAGPGFQRTNAVPDGPDMEPPNEMSASTSPKSIIPSSPPLQPLHSGAQDEHARADLQKYGANTDADRSGLQASSAQDVSGSVQQSNGLHGYGATPGGGWDTIRKDRNKHSSPFSGTYVTPRRHPQSEGCTQQTIPETSLTARRTLFKHADSTPPGHRNGLTSPNNDDGLPPILRHSATEHRAHLRGADVPKGNMSDPVSAIFSSPSGRQRRSMTEIATDMSPRPALPDVRLDELGFITAEDREYQALVAEPEHSPVRKRRRMNGGGGVRASVRRYRPIPSNLSTAAATRSDSDPHKDNINENGDDKHEADQQQSTEQENDNPQNVTETRHSQQSQARPGGSGKHQVAHAVVIRTPCSSSPLQAKVDKKHSTDPQGSVEADAAERDQSYQSAAEQSVTLNRVIAFFNGRPQGYFPATCVGMSRGADKARCLVKFEDLGSPDEIEVHNLKRLELRVHDQVKVDYPGLPRKPFVVVGFADKLEPVAASSVSGNNESAPVTDIYGHNSLIVKPRQPEYLPTGRRVQTVTVPMSSIYFDKALWSRLGDRPFSYSPEENDRGPNGCRSLNEIRSPAPFASRKPIDVPEAVGLFSDMAFALSGKDKQKLLQIESLITLNGGRILDKGFDELLELPSATSVADLTNGHEAASKVSIYETALKLNSKAEHTGFVCLITDECSRTYKYLQALALNLPCLSGRWIRDCISKKQLVDWEHYLLAAGQSKLLDDATKSRVLARYSAATARLSVTVDARSKLLGQQSVLLVMGRGKATKEREPYASLICSLGPSRTSHVQDFETAMDTLKDSKSHSADRGWDWVYVGDEKAADTAKQSLETLMEPSTPRGRGRPRKHPLPTMETAGADDIVINGRTVKILDNEILCQSLIFGRLLSWSDIG